MYTVTLNSVYLIAWEIELKGIWALWKHPFIALGWIKHFDLWEKGEQNPECHLQRSSEWQQKGQEQARVTEGWEQRAVLAPNRGWSRCMAGLIQHFRATTVGTCSCFNMTGAVPEAVCGLTKHHVSFLQGCTRSVTVQSWSFGFRMNCNWCMEVWSKVPSPSCMFRWSLVCSSKQSEELCSPNLHQVF